MASPAAVRDLQRDLENKANDLSKIQKELELLKEDANVYKLIGPVLVKQDLAEANANVRKRIEYISAELKRHDATLQDLEEKQSSKREAAYVVKQMLDGASPKELVGWRFQETETIG
ncbi:Prefoldin subunit 6 [Linum perenne]